MALECGLWPSADRAAAESGVAGLGSEPMATLCGSGLSHFLNIVIRTRAACQTSPVALRRHRLALRALLGCRLCQPGRHLYGPRRSSSFARHDHASVKPVLRKVRLTMSRRCVTTLANGELLSRMWPGDVVLQALVDHR